MKEIMMTLGMVTEQEALMELVYEGEWMRADGNVFIHDNLDDEEF